MADRPTGVNKTSRFVVGALIAAAGVAVIGFVVAQRRRKAQRDAARGPGGAEAVPDYPGPTAFKDYVFDEDTFVDSNSDAVKARYNGLVRVTLMRMFELDTTRRNHGDAACAIFNSHLYLQEYNPDFKVHKSNDLDGTLLTDLATAATCGSMPAAVDAMKHVYQLVRAQGGLNPNDPTHADVARTLMEWAPFIYEYGHDLKTAMDMFDYGGGFLMQSNQMDDDGFHRTFLFLYMIGDPNTALAMSQQQLLELAKAPPAQRKSTILPLLEIVMMQAHALGQSGNGMHAEALQTIMGCASLIEREPRTSPDMQVSVLWTVALLLRRAGKLQEAMNAYSYLMTVVEQLGSAGMMPPLTVSMAMLSAMEESGQSSETIDQVFETAIEQIAALGELPLPHSDKRPKTAPKTIGCPASLSVFTKGHFLHACFLYGPRDATGKLATPFATEAQMSVGLQFTERLTPGDWVFIVGTLHVIGREAPVTMRWRLRATHTYHTRLELRGTPIANVPAGLHRLTLELFSDERARPEDRILKLRQVVSCLADTKGITDRESRAVWRFLEESCGWRNLINDEINNGEEAPAMTEPPAMPERQVLQPGAQRLGNMMPHNQHNAPQGPMVDPSAHSDQVE